MSLALMVKAMKTKVGNPIRKLILVKLADNANDKGECWPSYQHIADQCECSKTAVRNHIDYLEKMGLIERENRIGNNNGKGNTSNVYFLKLDDETMSPKSTGVCHQMAHPMPPDGTPPMPPDGTRISNSFEPVIEPKKTNKKISSNDSKPAKQVSRNRQSKIPYQEIIQAFNEAVGDTLPNAETLNDKRKRAIIKFWKELKEPSLEAVKNYFGYFMETAKPWYFGENDRAWRANFDYLLRPDTITKTREGSL